MLNKNSSTEANKFKTFIIHFISNIKGILNIIIFYNFLSIIILSGIYFII